jgi:hypothetical protein
VYQLEYPGSHVLPDGFELLEGRMIPKCDETENRRGDGVLVMPLSEEYALIGQAILILCDTRRVQRGPASR